MYRLIKEKGSNKNVTLENTETKASVIIGRMTMNMLDLLREVESITFSDMSSTKLTDEWYFEISTATAEALYKTAMDISTPTHTKEEVKRPTDKIIEMLDKKENSKIDAMDVMLGLVNYK